MMSKLCWFFIVFLLHEKSTQTPIQETLKCECGEPEEDFVPRIVGGRQAQSDKHPWMVAIMNNLDFCGGTLINDRYILTAGHCLRGAKADSLDVYLGVYTLMDLKSTRPSEVESFIIHENFTSYKIHDKEDIGLIKLKYPVKFTPKIKPVCLPRRGEQYIDLQATVLGWGLKGENGDSSTILMETEVTTMANEVCRNNSIIGSKIRDTYLCAYGENTDACQGDSGGPLIYKTETGKMEQIGVVSWGVGCARPGIPGVYTRITSYLDWLEKHMEDAKYCRTPANSPK